MKWWIGTLALIGFLTGCGTTNTHLVSAHSVQTALPKGVENSLSAPKARMRKATSLPVKRVAFHSLQNDENVLYIAPNEVYAIQQFRSIWGHLKIKPTVVWTDSDKAAAIQLWSKEGFKKDPLPSNKTFYSSSTPPTPDAYHKIKSGTWDEEPGILSDASTGYWIKFF
ncbi:hypothetical protein [Alicyclobacillus fodiniaquatilis]|uniref:Uncharacterized protein n=1 Tax=Alicyclobacillus fodiniaquatilis TaxID=1661150 RepID=A0ABW4JDX4_9BACL